MVTDIGHVFLGAKHYISAPEPIDGISPVTHIAFKDESFMGPESLDIRSGKSSTKRVSRRSQSYNQSRPGTIAPSRQSSMRQPSIRRFDPATEETIGNIDRMMEPEQMSEDDHIVEEDEDRMSSRSMEREPSPEPEMETPIERPSRRRIVRRNV